MVGIQVHKCSTDWLYDFDIQIKNMITGVYAEIQFSDPTCIGQGSLAVCVNAPVDKYICLRSMRHIDAI